MKRSPIKRKTPIRSQKNQTKKLSGSNVTVPRSRSEAKRVRIQKRSKTNSRKWEDLDFQQQYHEEYPACELFQTCKDLGVFLRNEDKWHTTLPGTDLHHIFHAGKVRLDVRSNVICLCRQIHDMDAICGKELRVACLWLKFQKSKHDPSEFVIEELNRAAGATRADAQPVLAWLEGHTMCHDAFVPLREELLEALSGDSRGLILQ